MAIGERIRFLRTMRGMTQKRLGMAVGFPEKSADVRMAQYENGSRTPKAELTTALAEALEVSPQSLNVPEIDTDAGLIHTLFALEDIYGLKIEDIGGNICLKVDVSQGQKAEELHRMLCAWYQVASLLKAGEITRSDYDEWRYR